MKVLFISTEYPPNIYGGGGVFLYNLVQGLSKYNLSMIILTKKHGRKVEEDSCKSCEDSTRKISKRLFVKSPDVPPRHVWFQIRSLRSIIDIIDLVKPDIIHANSFSAGLIFKVLANRNVKIPKVVTVHGYPRHYLYLSARSSKYCLSLGQLSTYVFGFPSWEYILRLELKYSDKVVVVAKFIKEYIKSDYGVNEDKVVHIPNGINMDDVVRKVSTCKLRKTGNGYHIVVSGGRLYYEKGHLLLIYAVKKIINKGFKDVYLYLFGEGPLRNLLQKKIREFNLSRHVRIIGKVPHDFALCLLNIADVVVIPSLYEIMPMMLLEALALKKPVITLKTFFVNELTNLGIHIETAKNIDELAEKILIHLLDRHGIQRRDILDRNYKILSNNFAIDKIAKQYIKLYEEITTG